MREWNPIKKFRHRDENKTTVEQGTDEVMESRQIRCGTVFDISLAGQKYAELAEVLKEPGAVQLSARELQKIDAAGLQLLVAFFREAEKLQKDVSWLDTSEVLVDAARLLGLDTQLQIDRQTT